MSAVEPLGGVWGILADKVEAEPTEDRPGLWDALATRVDPAEFRPQLASDVEVKVFKLRWGNDYAMVANPRDLVHYRLEPWEADLLPVLDGTRTVGEIVVERLQESGDLDPSAVTELVQALYEGGFLQTNYRNVTAAVKHALDPVSGARRHARQFVKELSVEWTGAERLVRWFYRHGLKWFFVPAVGIPAFGIAIAGFVAFVAVQLSGRFELSASAAVDALVLIALDYVLTFVHELAHALVLVHYGRRVKSAGFMIYFGSPAFFVESSDGLMLERRQRIVQGAGGPYAEMILAGLASLWIWVFPESAASSLLYKWALLNYLVIFLNLVPLLELDGYFILSDLIQVPDLRPRSLGFIQHDLWHKLRVRERFTKQEAGLALYGILGVAFTILSFYTAAFFWHAIFGSLIADLWGGGPGGRVFLVVLVVFIGGPVMRGGINLGRTLLRRGRSVYRRIRFRFETKWRVEAAQLIDALPAFEDLPEDLLSDLAGRVRLRSLHPGQPVFRQGDRADAFFVVRRGTVQVVEEDPQTADTSVLRTLSRGESFGELGLLEHAPRAATVRAATETELFEVDESTFDYLLADTIRAPDFAPTLQAVAELQSLSAFAGLESRELSDILAHGRWINVSPGEAIVEQGEVGDAFYAIRSGQVDVIRDEELVRTLGPGDYFGEVALLKDVPRTAAVAARTPVRAFRLDREGFDRVVAGAFRGGTLRPAAERTSQH